MIVAGVDLHGRDGRHVAGDAGRAGRARAVEVMLRHGVLRRQMALPADAVAGLPKLQRVRLVAIATGDALREHPALEERAVVVDLAAHLAVAPVETFLEERDAMGVEQWRSVDVVFGELAGARVAAPAELDLARRVARAAALRLAGRGIDGPVDVAPLVERDRQPPVRLQAAPVPLAPGPGHVVRAGSVAGLAGDVDLGEGGGVSILLRIEVLGQIGRVALRAHEVPVLLEPGPVQRVAGPKRLVRVQREPALSPFGARPRVPGDAEGLDPAARELDQVLLKRRHAERPADLEIGERPVRAVRAHEVFVVASKKARRHARVSELRAAEVAQHAGLVGELHGEVVMRALPGLGLARVAARADLAADVDRRRRSGGRRQRRVVREPAAKACA